MWQSTCIIIYQHIIRKFHSNLQITIHLNVVTHGGVCRQGIWESISDRSRVLSCIFNFLSSVSLLRSYYIPSNLSNVNLSITSGFPRRPLEGTLFIITWKQEICSLLSFGFFFFFVKILTVIRGTSCNTAFFLAFSYNIAIKYHRKSSYFSHVYRRECRKSRVAFSSERQQERNCRTLFVFFVFPRKKRLFSWKKNEIDDRSFYSSII